MAAPNPAADVRQMIEDVKARHVYGKWATSFDGREHWGCMICLDSYPCDAVRLADKLEQAVTALEFYADPENYRCFDGWTGSPADNDAGKRARNALRSMAGGK